MFENQISVSLKDGRHGKISIDTFNGGELNIKLPFMKNFEKSTVRREHHISAHIVDSEGLMAILMINDAIKNAYGDDIELSLYYLPYARQDRVCNFGEAFSLRVVANMVNSCNFKKVTVYDCHSDVGVALIDNCVNKKQFECIQFCCMDNPEFKKLLLNTSTVIVSPDSGALKKTYEVAKHFSNENIVQATKYRNVQTGKIEKTVVFCDDLKGATCLIVDDICEYGGTFIALAKELKEKGAGDIHLYTTHGIYPAGKDELNKVFKSVTCAFEFKRKENN